MKLAYALLRLPLAQATRMLVQPVFSGRGQAEQEEAASSWIEAPFDNHRARCWLWAALAAGLLLRVHCLIHPYLWLDEFVTLWSIQGETYSEMMQRALRWTASGPLFVLCYRASLDLLGNVDWGLKLPGVLGGTAAIAVAWWSALQLFDRRDIAVVSAWLTALGPQSIHFSQEARPYAIGALLLLGATGFLGAWLRSGRRRDLVGVTSLSLAAVGFHLLAALALVPINLVVFFVGIRRQWENWRWAEWLAAQLVGGLGLWFIGTQVHSLSSRHGSMLFETCLTMPTRQALDASLWSHWQLAGTVLLVGWGIWWFARRFPSSFLAQAWNDHRTGVILAASLFAVPSILLSILTVLRIIDCWPRYYFLFGSGIVLAFAWFIVGAFPPAISRWTIAVGVVSCIAQFNCVNGLPSCRLNGAWNHFGVAEQDIRRRFGPQDLVLSRSGLIEANHESFLTDPEGASYLKAFCEARSGSLPAEHWPMPFSPERTVTLRYLEQLFADRVLKRPTFWLLNIGTADFDYCDWIAQRYGDQLQKTDQIVYPMITLTQYRNVSIASSAQSAIALSVD